MSTVNINDLINAAQQTDEVPFTNDPFDVFLRVYGYSTDSLTTRVLMTDLYYVYTEFYYRKFKQLPHRNKFAANSNIYKTNKMRTTSPDSKNKNKFEWGLWCNEDFKKKLETFKETNTTWQKKYRKILGERKKRYTKKIAAKENELLEQFAKQLEVAQNTQPLKNDSTQE